MTFVAELFIDVLMGAVEVLFWPRRFRSPWLTWIVGTLWIAFICAVTYFLVLWTAPAIGMHLQ